MTADARGAGGLNAGVRLEVVTVVWMVIEAAMSLDMAATVLAYMVLRAFSGWRMRLPWRS